VLGEALLSGLEAAQPLIRAQQDLAAMAGRTKRVAHLVGPSPQEEQEVKVGSGTRRTGVGCNSRYRGEAESSLQKIRDSTYQKIQV
jgi:hypothetical protein